MSAISQKSISGITSITTPAGVDNVFTVHTNDTTERFRVDSNGNQVIAGILTASNHVFLTGGDLVINDVISHFGDGNTKIRFPADDTISYETAGSERLRITSDGKVGIGTDNPAKKLEVYVGSSQIKVKGNDAGSFHIDPNSTGGTQEALIGQANGDLRLQSGAGSYQANRANILLKNSNKHIIMNADATGNVGIGTDNPTTKLNVRGTIQAVDSVTGFVSLTPTGSIEIRRGDGGFIDFSTAASEDYDCRIKQTGNDLTFTTGGSGSASEKLRITSDGKMGLGTASPIGDFEIFNNSGISSCVVRGPQALLAIMGDSDNTGASETEASLMFTSDSHTILNSPLTAHGFEIALINEEPGSGLRFHDGTANAERLRITSAGKVGINETNPEANVEINRGSEGKYLVIGGDDANNGRALTFTSSEGGTGSNGALHTINAKSGNGAIAFATTGTERLRILSTGGITFNGDTAAANSLDDYEEGSWTPTVLSGGNIGTPSYTCTYTKIGRLVTINADIAHLTDTTSNTNIKIGGLPYVPSGTVAREYSAVCHGERYSGGDIIVAYLVYNSGSFGINFRFGVPTNHFSYVKHSHISDNGDDNNLRFTLTYEIT